MGIPFQNGKKVKNVTIDVIIIKFEKSKSLTILKCATWEKITNIIVKSKYQNTPWPIWGEPDKEVLKFWAKILEISPKIAKKNGKIIRGLLKFLNSYLFKTNKIAW